MDEHGRISINEGLEDAIIIRKEAHVGINKLICFCRIGDSIRAHIIVNCLNSLADCRSLQVILFDIREASRLKDWLLIFTTDNMVAKISFSELFLECFNDCLSILR